MSDRGVSTACNRHLALFWKHLRNSKFLLIFKPLEQLLIFWGATQCFSRHFSCCHSNKCSPQLLSCETSWNAQHKSPGACHHVMADTVLAGFSGVKQRLRLSTWGWRQKFYILIWVVWGWLINRIINYHPFTHSLFLPVMRNVWMLIFSKFW